MRLSEKNVANMADKKKRLEITGLFYRVLVRHVADKRLRSEARHRNEKCNVQDTKCRLRKELEAQGKPRYEQVQKYVAVLAVLAALQESSGNLQVLRPPQGRQVAVLE
jgi:hypothetical protein